MTDGNGVTLHRINSNIPWYSTSSGYSSDSRYSHLQVNSLNGIGLDYENGWATPEERQFFMALKKQKEYIDSMIYLYGFNSEEALLLEKAYREFNEKNNVVGGNRRKVNAFFSALACLYSGYSADSTQFKLMGSNSLTPNEAIEYFNDLGVDGNALYEAINNQHSTCAREQKRDFAHECAIYSVMANINFVKGTSGLCFDDINNLVGYKGDVYSGRMEIDDIKSDVSAYNIYYRMVECQDGNIWGAMCEYNNKICNGEINESLEFLTRVGGGNAELGMERIQRGLDKESVGTRTITSNSGAKDEEIEAATNKFLKHISNESGISLE